MDTGDVSGSGMGGHVQREASASGTASSRSGLEVVHNPDHRSLDYKRFIELMRPADLLEAQCMIGNDSLIHALDLAMCSGHDTYVAYINGTPHAMGGLNSHMESHIMVPWLLMSNSIIRHYREEFIEHTNAINERWQRTYSVLQNMVLASNHIAIKWLTRLGYTVEPETFEISGELFRNFHYVQSQPRNRRNHVGRLLRNGGTVD